MIEVKAEFYEHIDEYNFEKGFCITVKDLPKHSIENNPFFDNNDIVYIKTVKDKTLMFNDDDENGFYVSYKLLDIEDGYYPTSDYDDYDDDDKHKKIFTEEDVGKGMFDLMLNAELCRKTTDDIEKYLEKLEKENDGLYLYGKDDGHFEYNFFDDDDGTINNNVVDNYKDMTQQEIIDHIIKDNKDFLDNELQTELKEHTKEEEEEEDNIMEQLQDKNIKIVTKIDDDDSFVYDKDNSTLTFSKNNNEILRYIFKSNNEFMEKFPIDNIWNYNYTDNHYHTNAYEERLSYVFELYKNHQFEKMLEVDFENKTFNGVKVAIGKIHYLCNRASNDFVKLQDKEYIKTINRLSGIKADMVEVKCLSVDEYEIPVTIDFTENDNVYSLTIFNETSEVQWDFLKRLLTTGNYINNKFSKIGLMELLRELKIKNDVVEQSLISIKILHKLKNGADDDDE